MDKELSLFLKLYEHVKFHLCRVDMFWKSKNNVYSEEYSRELSRGKNQVII